MTGARSVGWRNNNNLAAEIAAAFAILIFLALLAILYTATQPNTQPKLENNVTKTIEQDYDENDEDEEKWEPWQSNIIPKNDGNNNNNFEYVVLAKENQNSYEDPLDEFTERQRHNSGHFRSSKSKVWDPHPQYRFKAFGQYFHINLKQDPSFASPTGLTVTRISNNSSNKSLYPKRHVNCYYSGILSGDDKSSVSVNLCHGMTGHIKTSKGNYLIKPTKYWNSANDQDDKDQSAGLEHLIYRLSPPAFRKTYSISLNDSSSSSSSHDSCGLIDNVGEQDLIIGIEDASESAKIYVGNPRTKRHASNDEDDVSSFALEEDDEDEEHQRSRKREYFIEVMVVADQKMMSYHGRSLSSYILVLMNTVSRIYKDSSIGNPVSIAVTKIKQIDEIFGSKQEGSDGIGAAEMLKKFCRWQKQTSVAQERHDAALLLTRENLCHDPGQKRCDTLGLAELGRMCSLGSSCAIVQDNGLATAFTIAHEIGHVLNMPHDDDPKCAKFRGDHNTKVPHNIMSRMLDDNTVPWEWSKCSRHYVTEFLDSGMANCLLDEPRVERHPVSRLPGEDYSKNEQCELVYGRGSVICPHHMPSDVCKRLWCTVPDWRSNKEQCHTQHMPWADGTSCGPGNEWCHRGECVSSSSRKNFEPVDGQWGEWSRYGECSRTCGGGIKRKHRECNKPAPRNGGNYCVGERIRYRSCATEDCPGNSLDFRERQCAEYDNDNRNIRNLPKSGLKWHAKYTRLLPEDRCKLYCQVAGNQYYMLRDKVVDGTTCGPDTHHVCVNGHCKPAGCDHVLDSRAELDACGVCRGDNSTCRIISGSYNSSEYGYTRITVIPAGSSYIDVRQHGWAGSHNDSNYLALRLKRTGRYILNGDFMVMHRKLIHVHPGLTMDYSGPDKLVERLNSSRPIRVDLVLEVLSVGEVRPAQVSYEYTVPINVLDRYRWSLASNWTSCDRMCQGLRYRGALCLEPESEEAVSKDYCPREARPRDEVQSCNLHCQLRWESNECVQIFGGGPPATRRKLPEYACYHLKRADQADMSRYSWRYSEWTNCSASCGPGGYQTRSLRGCFDESQSDEEHCRQLAKEPLKRNCNLGPCPEWTFSEWSPCNVECGIGKRERSRYCTLEKRLVSSDLCTSNLDPLTETCDAGACPVWQTGDWSSCSVSCGDGIRRRLVVCRAANGSVSDYCDSASKPINLISCALESCPSSSKNKIDPRENSGNEIDSLYSKNTKDYAWIVEGFKKCSRRCGGGFAYQIIKCVRINKSGKELELVESQDRCDASKRPKDIVACNEHQCPVWKVGTWTQCDVRCGEGYQHRQVLCQNLRGEVMNDADCSDKSRPRNLKRCVKPPDLCNNESDKYSSHRVTPKWHAGPWSECSVSCGTGVRRRELACRGVNGFGWFETLLPPDNCSSSSKPSTEQACETRACNDQYYWSTGPWKKCSQSCGRKGRQVRRLFCIKDRGGQKVGRLNCPKGLRPHRKRKCNQKPCTGPSSCLEVKSKLRSDADGEYSIYLGSRYVRIFCHDMKNMKNGPREYLSLPAGERENYSEVYDKRLKDSSSEQCPYSGRRNDSCECTLDERVSGRTMFHKIRIDLRTLDVIADDFEFSVKMGANNIEYGRAGDCYSRANCPQGRFGINLSGTPFVLDPRVQWLTSNSSSSHSIIHKINDQRIVGKCGGYCGFCGPHPGIKLHLIPYP